MKVSIREDGLTQFFVPYVVVVCYGTPQMKSFSARYTGLET